MKVILYGASGMIGSRILDELVSRQHQVIAVTRHPSKIARRDVESRAGDVLDSRGVAETVRGGYPTAWPTSRILCAQTFGPGLDQRQPAGTHRARQAHG